MNHNPQHPDDDRPTPDRDGDDTPPEPVYNDNGPRNYWPMRGDV